MTAERYHLLDFRLKLLALLGAFSFFVYKIAAGSLVPASSLSLVAAPIACEGDVCALVTTKLEHPGENWSFYIKCAELTVVEDGKPTLYSPIRYRHPSRDTFELGPGEKTEYGTIVKGLPFGKPVIVEALFVLEQKAPWGLHWLLEYTAYDFASIAVSPLKRDQGQRPAQELGDQKQGDQREPLPSCKKLGLIH